MAPVLNPFRSIRDRKSLLALGWSITSLFSLLALIAALIISIISRSYYKKQYGEENQEIYKVLESVSSFSVIFAGLYTVVLAFILSCFGSLCVVGYVSFKGKYIAPIYTGTGSSNVNPKFAGIFLGALVLFSNMCLVIAVILGEFEVGNYLDQHEKQELGYFRIEKISRLLATIAMGLSLLYTLYSILFFTSKEVLVTTPNEENENIQEMGYIAPIHSIT